MSLRDKIAPCLVLLLSTQFFYQRKYFLLVVTTSPDSITKGKVFDKVCITLSSDLC